MVLRELSLFTGAGGGIYGSKLLGWQTVGYVENDFHCQRVIAQRIKDGVFDEAQIFGDIRIFADTFAESYRGVADVITAGFPCTPYSSAGKRRGRADERNLWPETLRVLSKVRPQWALLENVPGLLSDPYFGTILAEISEAGYSAKWDCISAEEVGAPHKRERLWILLSHRDRQLFDGAREPREARRDESPDCAWWASEPGIRRVDDGMAAGKHKADGRVNRLRALGNGQVPRVVEEAWKRLRGI